MTALYAQKSASAIHYVNPKRLLDGVVCGYAMTEEQHRDRTRRDMQIVTCKECYRILLERGHEIRGKRKVDMMGGSR